MPLRSRKPTSAGRRFQTVSDFAEITRDRPEKSLAGTQALHRWPQQPRPQDLPAPRRRPQAAVPDHRLQTGQGRCSRQGGRHRVRPQPQRPHRPAPLPRRREALHPRPVPGAGGGHAPVGQGAEIRPGNALPLRYIPVGSVIHNVELRPGGGGKMARGAGMSVQLVAKEGAFATLRLPSTEMRRVPIDCRATLGRGGQLRGRADQDREGRPEPLEGHPPPDPRRGHEPGRPPAGWRRGQDVRWASPGVAVGTAGGPHPVAQEGVRQDDRPKAPHPRCPAVGKTEGTPHYAT